MSYYLLTLRAFAASGPKCLCEDCSSLNFNLMHHHEVQSPGQFSNNNVCPSIMLWMITATYTLNRKQYRCRNNKWNVTRSPNDQCQLQTRWIKSELSETHNGHGTPRQIVKYRRQSIGLDVTVWFRTFPTAMANLRFYCPWDHGDTSDETIGRHVTFREVTNLRNSVTVNLIITTAVSLSRWQTCLPHCRKAHFLEFSSINTASNYIPPRNIKAQRITR